MIPIANHEEFIKIISQFKIKYDKIDDQYFISFDDLYSEKNKPPIRLYIGLTNKKIWLRMKMYYESDDWLFANAALIKADSLKHKYSDLDFERDNYGGEIWEWHDRVVTKVEMNLIQKIIVSNEATVRFFGRQYHDDRDIDQSQKDMLKDILKVYEILNINKKKK